MTLAQRDRVRHPRTATRRSCSSAKNGSNKRRNDAQIFEPNDYVRATRSVALSRKRLLVPVLAPHAEARPAARGHKGHHHKEELPHRHKSIDDATEYVVAAVLGLLRPRERAWEEKGSLKAKFGYLIGGAHRRRKKGKTLPPLRTRLGPLLFVSIAALLTTLSAHCPPRSPARGPAGATKCGSGDCVEPNAHHPSMGANTVCSCSTPFSVNAPT